MNQNIPRAIFRRETDKSLLINFSFGSLTAMSKDKAVKNFCADHYQQQEDGQRRNPHRGERGGKLEADYQNKRRYAAGGSAHDRRHCAEQAHNPPRSPKRERAETVIGHRDIKSNQYAKCCGIILFSPKTC